MRISDVVYRHWLLSCGFITSHRTLFISFSNKLLCFLLSSGRLLEFFKKTHFLLFKLLCTFFNLLRLLSHILQPFIIHRLILIILIVKPISRHTLAPIFPYLPIDIFLLLLFQVMNSIISDHANLSFFFFFCLEKVISVDWSISSLRVFNYALILFFSIFKHSSVSLFLYLQFL